MSFPFIDSLCRISSASIQYMHTCLLRATVFNADPLIFFCLHRWADVLPFTAIFRGWQWVLFDGCVACERCLLLVCSLTTWSRAW